MASIVLKLVWKTYFHSHLNKGYGNTKYKWAATWPNQQNDCTPREDSDQPGHPPSLIRVFAVAHWVAKDPRTQAFFRLDQSLRWAHSHSVGFVVSRLKCLTCAVHADTPSYTNGCNLSIFKPIPFILSQIICWMYVKRSCIFHPVSSC